MAAVHHRKLTPRDLHHAVVENGMTAPSLCAVGLEQSSTQPTTGPLVLTSKQPDPPLAGWIYA